MVSIAVAQRQTGLSQNHEARREIPAIELHALDDVERRFQRLGFFNCDHAVLADFLHSLVDDGADRLVATGGDHPNLRDPVADTGLAIFLISSTMIATALSIRRFSSNGLAITTRCQRSWLAEEEPEWETKRKKGSRTRRSRGLRSQDVTHPPAAGVPAPLPQAVYRRSGGF
jgi:hypothetical protein